jgi:hypothetical protein
MASIEIDTAVYERSHGKSPKGYGGWVFSTERNPDPANDKALFWAPVSTYAEAKKWVKAEVAARFGDDAEGVVYVQP